MASAFVTSRKKASIRPAGIKAINIRPTAIADAGPDVGHHSRGQYGVARRQASSAPSPISMINSPSRRQPFILFVVQVAGWATRGMKYVFDDERAVAIRRT